MRSYDPEHRHSVRYRKKFLLIPRTFDGFTRWFETAYVRERYMELACAEPGIGMCFYHDWCEVGFVTRSFYERRQRRLRAVAEVKMQRAY